ncbi:MAG TPA: glutamate synthase subunit alpha, partial [Ornithinicoccus sp.]|nr:glutamate synthase subunit alpha [Ornithinicoccus sp.]
MNQSPLLPTHASGAPSGRPAGPARGVGDRPPGLYDGNHEHDACGVAFVATLRGYPGHDIVTHALTALENLDHRGAVGAEPDSGDGAGILTQVPDRFLREVLPVDLPEPGAYAVGLLFLPTDRDEAMMRAEVEGILTAAGVLVLAWREVPTRPEIVGPMARAAMPLMRQVVVASQTGESGIELERRVWLARKLVERRTEVYPVSLSARTITYKGMLTTGQLADFFPDLTDERYESSLAVVHSRFSTNTFPSWPLAHPYRVIAHNGEVNTVRGNRNWMHARESNLTTSVFPGDLSQVLPICTPGASDSATFDEVVELLYLGGRSLPHAVLMMVPEAWENNAELPDDVRAFYEFHATIMEPWDGPMNLVFTDGTQVGGVLDRNGLRPSRYWV